MIMKKIVATLLPVMIACCLLLFSIHIHAQNLDSVITRYGDQYQPERVYLHYDKAVYAPGETIWFKAYLVQGIAAADSKTLYVDWVDNKGSVLMHSVSPVVEGVTNGQFDIPAAYAGNSIRVRAYTKWMLNFDTSFLYNKDIRILNTSAAAGTPPAIVPALQFFPEGGDAVAGIKNKIAFKAADQWGRPIRISGVVQTAAGDMVDSLHIQHDGMGYFYIVPNPNTAYVARWKDAKGA